MPLESQQNLVQKFKNILLKKDFTIVEIMDFFAKKIEKVHQRIKNYIEHVSAANKRDKLSAELASAYAAFKTEMKPFEDPTATVQNVEFFSQSTKRIYQIISGETSMGTKIWSVFN